MDVRACPLSPYRRYSLTIYREEHNVPFTSPLVVTSKGPIHVATVAMEVERTRIEDPDLVAVCTERSIQVNLMM